jgi:hypothetical protein
MRKLSEMEYKSSVPGAENLNWSQKHPKAIRPQKPADATMGAQRWQPGQVPMGGYRSIICFGNSNSTKISNTEKP